MPKIISLSCPACGAQAKVPAGRSRFICDYCGTENLVQQECYHAPPPQQRPELPMPEQVTFEEYERGLRFTYRWFSTKYILLAFFCIVWDGFLVFWYSIAIGGRAPLIFVLFPLLHLAIGVYLTYSTLTGFINKSVITVTGKSITIEHGPLPWTGNQRIPVSSINQLYCKEEINRGKNSTIVTYDLYAIQKKGRRTRLLSGLENSDLGLFIEQQIERWLNIEDRPVGGELPRYA